MDMANSSQKVWVKLTDYEKQRMMRIEENKARLRASGICKLKESLNDSFVTRTMKSGSNRTNLQQAENFISHVEKKKEKSRSTRMTSKEAEKFTHYRDVDESDYSSEEENNVIEEELARKERLTSRNRTIEMQVPNPNIQSASFQPSLQHVSQMDEDLEHFQNDMSAGTDTQGKRKRGPTMLTWLFGSNTVLKLEWDDNGRVVGPGKNAVTFPEAIGVLLKTCPHIQWTVDWPDVGTDAKNWIWKELLKHFELDMSRKEKVMQLYGSSAFRNKKKLWKKRCYKPYQTDEERLLHKPEELSEAQWTDLINFWGTEEQQEIARQNTINREMLEVKHTTGRISFPRTIHEMEVAEGVRPSRGRLFEVTHTSKRTHDALDDVSRNYISKMRAIAGTNEHGTPLQLTDEHYYQVMPPDRHGRVRGQGPGITPTSYFGRCSSRTSDFGDMEKQIQDEVTRRVHEMKNELESQLKVQMMEQMQTMMKKIHSSMTEGTRNFGDETTFSPMLNQERDVFKKCKLMNWQKIIVAEGRIESTDPDALVHHIPLGRDTWKVWVDLAIDSKASLWRTNSEMSTIGDAVGSVVAWHKDYVSLD